MRLPSNGNGAQSGFLSSLGSDERRQTTLLHLPSPQLSNCPRTRIYPISLDLASIHATDIPLMMLYKVAPPHCLCLLLIILAKTADFREKTLRLQYSRLFFILKKESISQNKNIVPITWAGEANVRTHLYHF